MENAHKRQYVCILADIGIVTLIKQIGLMKSIIVSFNIVICYIGNNINNAAELLRNTTNSLDNMEDFISFAFKIHTYTSSEEDAIEFIIVKIKYIRQCIAEV